MRASFPCLTLLAAAIALTGCDNDASKSASTTVDFEVERAHLHVDGTVASKGDGFVLTPMSGDEPITFGYGPEVAVAEIRALEASKAVARVTFEPTEDAPVALGVDEAPKLEGLDTYDGTVVSINDDSLVIDGPDGKRTFTVVPSDGFDIEHLREHEDEGSPVRLYFDDDADVGPLAVAYEDA